MFKIIIPSSVNSFGSHIFDGIKTLEITGDIQYIPNKLFLGCSKLTQITIPSSVMSIGIPSSVKSIGNSAFYKCSKLAQILIPSSVISIGNDSFCECSSLKQISISSSVDTSFIGLSPKVKICHLNK